MPEFLQASFEMLRDGQSKAFENLGKANPLTAMPGFDAMRAQQAAFFKAMTGGLIPAASKETTKADDDLGEIKNQLAALQEKLSKLGK